MRWLLTGLCIALALVGISHDAHAHTALVDSTGSVGAIVHLSPDDSPVAGEPAIIFFDGPDTLLSQANVRATLRVTDQQGVADTVQASISDGLATFDYTFATQGVYSLMFTIETPRDSATFHHTQRISRGTALRDAAPPHHQWAEALLFVILITLVTLWIVAFHRRREITRQSRF